MKRFKDHLVEEKRAIYTADHIRVLAGWAEKLNLTDAQKSGYELYHKMKTGSKVSSEEIGSIANSIIGIIQYHEKDKKMFYNTMRAWGIQ